MVTALVTFWGWVKKAAVWLWDHWYIPLFVAGLLAGWLLTRRSASNWSALKQLATELEAIKAGAEVREVKASAGAQAARAHVEERYKEALAQLDERQREEAKVYEQDPIELARFLVRVASPESR